LILKAQRMRQSRIGYLTTQRGVVWMRVE